MRRRSGRSTHRGPRYWRYALESAGRARLVDRHLHPARRRDEGDDDALRLRPRRVPVPRRRFEPDRGGAAARRLTRPLFPGVLLLEFGGGCRDARHRELLPARGLPEP